MEKDKEKKKRPPRQPMPMQDPSARVKNFDEVPLGYSQEMASVEAGRCIQCKDPKCIDGCPVLIDIPSFIQLIEEGRFMESARKLKEANSLPAICGRVCPQEDQCEKVCVLAKKGEPVAIGRLERFAADYEQESGDIQVPEKPERKGSKVAIVGAGPAGLTCAGDLARMGYDVTIFEALQKAGGVLVYGIPEFRLPKKIVAAEIDYLRMLGIEIVIDAVIGRYYTVDELLSMGYGAVFIGIGAGAPRYMGVPGENLNGILSSNEFLTRVNLMKGYLLPEYDPPAPVGRRMIVIGGGNTAMDSARTALRLGAEEVRIIYRRSREEMPAREEEIERGAEEGVVIDFLAAPTRYLADSDGHVKAAECIRMELGEPDDSGRRRPVPIEGSEFTTEVDTVIVGIGTTANPLLPSLTPGLETNSKGYIIADPETGRTSKESVWAGGDIVTGAATVIEAMGAGKRAAADIDKYLSSERLPKS